ncbi:MAG: cyclic nucleotide-binding domain-containing protein [Ignavibacteriaceae bacterium]|nr:cyclic nucleotide-binding domain-containing protein [Ignavibacteriaceae bacterium]
MIVDAERIRLLKTNGLFKGISESVLKPYLKPKYFFEAKEGEVLYICGDKTAELFLIVEGEVKIKSSGNGNVKHKYLSDFFGEEEILKSGERSSSAVAETDCVLFRISSTEFKQLASTNKKIADNLNYKKENESSGSPGIEPSDYNPPVDPLEEQDSNLLENLDNLNLDDDVNWIFTDDK